MLSQNFKNYQQKVIARKVESGVFYSVGVVHSLTLYTTTKTKRRITQKDSVQKDAIQSTIKVSESLSTHLSSQVLIAFQNQKLL